MTYILITITLLSYMMAHVETIKIDEELELKYPNTKKSEYTEKHLKETDTSKVGIYTVLAAILTIVLITNLVIVFK